MYFSYENNTHMKGLSQYFQTITLWKSNPHKSHLRDLPSLRVHNMCHICMVSNPVVSHIRLVAFSVCGHRSKYRSHLKDFFHYECAHHVSSNCRCMKSEINTSHIKLCRASHWNECKNNFL